MFTIEQRTKHLWCAMYDGQVVFVSSKEGCECWVSLHRFRARRRR
jgi:hypothetical protein